MSSVISDQRVELMVVSPNTRVPEMAQFLAPTISVRTLPDRPPKPTSTISNLSSTLEDVDFLSWVNPQKSWTDWVNSMKSVHGPMWKTVGIYDGIMHSLLEIPKNKSLVCWFAEKWSPKTNTFVLPWGETTITLEDMMVLGGYSVLGGPATSHIEVPVDYAAFIKLEKAYLKIVRSPLKKVSFRAWRDKFMGRQKAYEHEAFLVLWLSKYIFASAKNTISHETFHLAIFLARGRRIALAPAVLATLYRDLHFLQSAILDAQQGNTNTVVCEVFSPMYYIQVWIWERFASGSLSPSIHNILNGETRLHEWARANIVIEMDNLERIECFTWRPYANANNHFISQRVYDKHWPLRRRMNNEEVESFVRCLRACKLVGFDIIQDYSPHRVCRQFGYDQDVPADIIQIEDNIDPWVDYSLPLLTGSVYIPPRDFKGRVSARYEEWWGKDPVSVSPHDLRVPLPTKQRRKRIRAL